MARAVRVSKTSPEKEKRVSYNFEFRHQFIVGIRPGSEGPTFEEVQEDIRQMLREKYPNGNYTTSGGYILIDGRGCYPWDFDYETGDRKPGTHPPLYTLTDDEQKEIRLQERIAKEREREVRTGNNLATNPTHLLTADETSRLRKLREKQNHSPVPPPPSVRKVRKVERVEWTEADANNEELADQETEKLLARMPVRKKITVRRRG